MTREVWARGSCQVGNECVESAEVRAGGRIWCVVAVVKTAVFRIVCRGCDFGGDCEGRVFVTKVMDGVCRLIW